jgi:hypothetical protein
VRRQGSGSARRVEHNAGDILRGDDAAAEAKYDVAIERYQHGWKDAIHLSIRLVVRSANGTQQVEFPAIPGERHDIEMSTNLTDWAIVATYSAGADGLVRFDEPAGGNRKAGFCRTRLLP